jgi:FkbM family methyltransferase
MTDIKQAVKKVLKAVGVNVSYLNLPRAFKDQKKYINKNTPPVIFDVGANKGQTYLRYRTLFPKAKIYVFEPFEAPYKQLLVEVHGDNLAHPEQIGIASTRGVRTLYLTKHNYTNSLLQPLPIEDRKTHEHDGMLQRVGEVEIKTDTIDSFMTKNKINNIDILKMDIQGGELDALKGATQALGGATIGLIYCEVSFLQEYRDQPLFDDINNFLNKFGYKLEGLYDEGRDATGQLLQADAIFLSQKAKSRLSK